MTYRERVKELYMKIVAHAICCSGHLPDDLSELKCSGIKCCDCPFAEKTHNGHTAKCKTQDPGFTYDAAGRCHPLGWRRNAVENTL